MESTGKAGAIQVTEETCQILQMFSYTFEQRGLVAVKGKGQLMTYYLQGKSDKPQTSPLLQSTMQTVHEIEEFSPPPPVTMTTTVSMKPESPNPLTLSSATASPSSVRLNQNYQPNTDNEMNDNLESLESNCEESINELKSANGSINHSEKDPLLNESPKIASTNHSSNHLRGDENDALLQNGA
jgi:Adenylate and Guanylate cyclase catalytic domain